MNTEKKTQIGTALTGNLKEGTCTFQMEEGFERYSGDFVIIPIEFFEKKIDPSDSVKSFPERKELNKNRF